MKNATTNPGALTITSGMRLRNAGDMSNDPRMGTTTALADGWAWVRWDGEEHAKPVPVAAIVAARWTILPCEETAARCDVFGCATHTVVVPA